MGLGLSTSQSFNGLWFWACSSVSLVFLARSLPFSFSSPIFPSFLPTVSLHLFLSLSLLFVPTATSEVLADEICLLHDWEGVCNVLFTSRSSWWAVSQAWTLIGWWVSGVPRRVKCPSPIWSCWTDQSGVMPVCGETQESPDGWARIHNASQSRS